MMSGRFFSPLLNQMQSMAAFSTVDFAFFEIGDACILDESEIASLISYMYKSLYKSNYSLVTPLDVFLHISSHEPSKMLLVRPR